jgi:hypothetical protein
MNNGLEWVRRNGVRSSGAFRAMARSSILEVTRCRTMRSASIACVALIAFLGAGGLHGQKQTDELILPNEIGQSVVIEIPGLPLGARKLELVLVPGAGKVPSFLLGKFEITQGQYESLMHTNPSTFRKGPDYPVEETSWQDAKDFCERLSTILPRNRRADHRFRLPTDDEWSVAVGLPEEPGQKSARAGPERIVATTGTRVLPGPMDSRTRRRWAVIPPIDSACMTWAETCGSGARIGRTKR